MPIDCRSMPSMMAAQKHNPSVSTARRGSVDSIFNASFPGKIGIAATGGQYKLKIIAVTNIKGGVGKTTTADNLAYLSCAGGRSTVLWDLDPQGAATYTLKCEPNERASVKQLLSGKRELPELVVHTEYERLDVLPADFSYRNFEVHLSEKRNATQRLLRMSRPLAEQYDVLFLDCPPGISRGAGGGGRAAGRGGGPRGPAPV